MWEKGTGTKEKKKSGCFCEREKCLDKDREKIFFRLAGRKKHDHQDYQTFGKKGEN